MNDSTSPELLRALLDAMVEPVCSSTPDGRVAFANRAALELLGVERLEDVLHKPLQPLLPEHACAAASELGELGTLWRFRRGSGQLKPLLEQAPVPIALLSGPQHRFEFVSRPYREFFLQGREYVGLPAAQVLPEAVEQGFIGLLDRVRAEGERYQGQETLFELVEPDGSRREFYFNFVYEPIRDDQGRVESILAVISDISEQVRARNFQTEARRQVERAARELETERAKLEVVFQETPAAMALYRGPELIFEKVNEGYQALFQGRPLLNLPLMEALPELHGQVYPDLLRGVLESGQPVIRRETMARLVTRQGGELEDRYFDITYVQLRDDQGQPYGVYNHSVDVTERVLARRRLEESEVQLSRAVAVSKVGFFDWDVPGNQIHFSEQIQADWGVGSGGPLEGAMEFIHPEDRERVAALVQQTMDEKLPYYAEYRVVRTGRPVMWVQAQGAVSYDERRSRRVSCTAGVPVWPAQCSRPRA
jgi:two-component system, sensor histidine kinase